MQLHRSGIAHQDLKQSNVLQFNAEKVSKIADLGRAIDRARPVWYDAHPWSGDKAYAPPDVAYGFHQSEFNARRFASDMYLLGSFACVLFASVPLNFVLYGELPAQLRPRYFGGPYEGDFESVAAHLQDAHDRSIAQIMGNLDASLSYREELVAFIRQWTDPDPRKRGHPLTRKMHAGTGNVYDLERYVSSIANMVGRASVFDRTQKQA